MNKLNTSIIQYQIEQGNKRNGVWVRVQVTINVLNTYPWNCLSVLLYCSSSKPHFEVLYNYLSSDSLFICCVVGWIFLSHCINVTADFRNSFETRTPALWWRYGHMRLIIQSERDLQSKVYKSLINHVLHKFYIVDWYGIEAKVEH